MSVEKIAAELGQVLTLLDLGPLVQALELVDEAEHTLVYATHGSQRPEAAQALAFLGQIKQQLGQVYQTATAAKALVEGYLANIAGGTGKANPIRDQADTIRATLPPTVPMPNPTGKKTHGKWFDGSGREAHIVSGRDDDTTNAWRLLQAAGMPTNSEPASVTHVEMKAAARAVQAGVEHTEVVLNNVPCGPRRFSCDALLPILLPEGYSLTVHGPNYRKRYTGGKKWSS